jgi:hypothetical protein
MGGNGEGGEGGAGKTQLPVLAAVGVVDGGETDVMAGMVAKRAITTRATEAPSMRKNSPF